MSTTIVVAAPRPRRRAARLERRRAQVLKGALLRRSGRGDLTSFGDFYDLVVGDSYRLALLRLRDPALAERAARRAMVEAWRQSNRWVDQPLSATAWLATLTEAAAAAERPALAGPAPL